MFFLGNEDIKIHVGEIINNDDDVIILFSNIICVLLTLRIPIKEIVIYINYYILMERVLP